MSKQTDIEMLFLMAAEDFANKQNLSREAIIEKFNRKQVFEKMLIQHEYLHQVSSEEVIEFIEDIIEEKNSNLIVFHGSCSQFKEVDLTKSRNRRDFGVGFYTTLLYEQSEIWAKRLAMRKAENAYYVYKFIFEESHSLDVKRFNSLDEDWLEFVKVNRIKGGVQHSFDVVIGPVADDYTTETVQLYISETITCEEAINRLRYSKVNNQVSFHTSKALDYLTLIERCNYDNNLHI